MTGLLTNPKPHYATKKEKEFFKKFKRRKKIDINKAIDEMIKIAEKNKKLEEQLLLNNRE